MSEVGSNITSIPKKPGGYQFYRDVLGSPKYIVAPMVDQSELAWRRLSRRYGAQLIYTPMINAKMFVDANNKTYRNANFDLISGEEGDPTTDRPLIVQFCANDPEQLLISAKVVEKHCDAVDLNLGCPQDIAKRGRYGSFLQDDWDLIYKLINILHVNLSIPVTAKFRVFPTIEKTVEYAKMLERAGAQIITCHGRLREQRGQNTGLADWDKIRAVKQAVSVPVFANGNILYQADIDACLKATGADGVMSAEGQLYNPALFAGIEHPLDSPAYDSDAQMLVRHPRHVDLALEYLEIVKDLKTTTSVSGIKGHLFKILRPGLVKEQDLREKLGKVRISPKNMKECLQAYVDVCNEMKERMEPDAKAAEGTTLKDLITVEPITGIKVMPHWLAQPYFRPSAEQKKAYAAAQATLAPPAEDVTPTPAPAASAPTNPKRPLDESPEGTEDTKRARLAPEALVPSIPVLAS
ncbi:Dus-domain-containing protein [Flammula alnicola]|nr:Dus-domain-containing protein [Flammula alnicola]